MRGIAFSLFVLAGCQLDWDALIGDGGGDGGGTDAGTTDASVDGGRGDAGIVDAPITQLSAGGHHTCAIRGVQLLCWGRNDRGQLGAGHRGPVEGAALVPLRGVKQVSAGALHTCAIDETDTLHCWGEPSGGRLGTDGEGHAAPRPVPLPDGARHVAAGVEHTCAVLVDGVVYCWGTGQKGEVGGAPGVTVRASPQPVRSMTGIDAQEVAVGEDHSCAWAVDGSVWCWGEGALLGIEGGVPTGTPVRSDANSVTRLVSGLGHVCVVRTDRAVACWGNGFSGEIGNGTMAQQRTPAVVPALAAVSDLAAGGHHTCAATEGGELYCWGRGTTGALGVDERTVTMPVRVPGASVDGPIAAGGTDEDDHTCALGAGELWCWGHRAWGQLGDGAPLAYPSPTDVAGLVDDVSVGGGHLCYRVSSEVSCLGRNGDHQAGDPIRAPVSLPEPIELEGPLLVALGRRHSCATGGDPEGAFCWGDDAAGQVGDGALSPRESLPRRVVTPMDLGPWNALAAGARHTCGISDGAVWCWGDGARGAVGLPDAGATPMANRVIGTGAAGIAAGTQLSCALIADGRVECWGAGDRGQRGASGGLGDSSTPMAVPLSGAAHTIGAGHAHACAATVVGIECWGDSTEGQLGASPSPLPVPVPMRVDAAIPSPVSALALGEGHTCALARDATVWCWGRNDYGQLGRGHLDPAPEPAPVPGLEDVLDVVAYDHQTCARTMSSLVCWGMAAAGRIVPTSGEELFVHRPIVATAAGE